MSGDFMSGDFLVEDFMSYVAQIGDFLSGDFISRDFLTWIRNHIIQQKTNLLQYSVVFFIIYMIGKNIENWFLFWKNMRAWPNNYIIC